MSAPTPPEIKPSTPWLRLFILALLALIIGRYFSFHYHYAINIPKIDDIYDVLYFITQYEAASGAREKFAQLYRQHNEHITLASRLVYLIAYKIQGVIDFRTLTLIANTGLVAILVTFFGLMSGSPNRWLLLVPISLILFQIRCYGLTTFTMMAMSFFYVFTYGFACLYCLQNPGFSRFCMAIVFAILASCTLASGQLIWLLGLGSLLLSGSREQGAARKCLVAIWCIAGVLVLVFCRIGLEPAHHYFGAAEFPSSLGSMLLHLIARPFHYAQYFLALLGSALSQQSVTVVTVAGALMLGCLLWSTWRQWQNDMGIELAAWFVVLSTALITLARANAFEVSFTLSGGQYQFPSVLMLACTVAILGTRLNGSRKSWALAPTVLALVFWVHSWNVYTPQLIAILKARVAMHNEDKFVWWPSGMEVSQRRVVRDAMKYGIYTPPDRPYRPFGPGE